MYQAPIIAAFYIPVNNYALKLIIDQITTNENFSLNLIIFPVTLFCTMAILMEVAWRVANFADYVCEPLIESEIINQSYALLLNFNYQFFQNSMSGRTASRINHLREAYTSITDNLRFTIIFGVLGIFITLVLLISVNKLLALMVLIWLIFFTPLTFMLKKKGLFYSEKATSERQKIAGLINDGISNISNILLFGARRFERKLVRKAGEKFISAEKQRLKFLFINHLLMGTVFAIISISVLFLLIHLKTQNLITTGDFAMVMGLMFFFLKTFWGLLDHLDFLMRDFGVLKESFKIFQKNQPVFSGTKKLVVKKPTIEFQNIKFNYPEDNFIFDDFNLTIEAGEKIGLVGSSGAGKSSLINLLLRIFIPKNGKILIDGTDISNLDLDSLRSHITIIPQEPTLFHRSILENIAYGKVGASKREILKAAKKAHIHEFVKELPNGYRTIVGERGIKLSGGQRQRIAIARAFLKDAPILILDEATSSLDSTTEIKIQNSIQKMLEKKKMTVIAIAHRLSTIKNLDRIIVIDKGKIIDDGKFDKLIRKADSKFKKMWEDQSGEIEN